MATPKKLAETDALLILKKRLEKCWELDIDWSLYPSFLQKGLAQLGKALDVPATAVLSGLLLLESYCISHSTIKVPNTAWTEPCLLWITTCMPTGSGKTPLFSFLTDLLDKVRSRCALDDSIPWTVDDATIEKMGSMMAKNGNKLLGIYDELSTFLTQINVYRGKGISDSHDLSAFLSLYNAKSWNRDTVSGDANFHMRKSGLTVGGFTQPSVAKSLLESQPAVEKGLIQRFLWIFPKPLYSDFEDLQPANTVFTEYLISKLVSINSRGNSVLSIPADCEVFKKQFNEIQGNIAKISVCDELLAGMLGKAKGQILRVAACLEMLFCDSEEDSENTDEESESADEESESIEDDNISIQQVETLPTTISSESLKAAINFVEVCCQHTAYVTGRKTIESEVKKYQQNSTLHTAEVDEEIPIAETIATAGFCLTLKGRTLDLSALLTAKKFRDRHNKPGALLAMEMLQREGLGNLILKKASRGTSLVYLFKKATIPDDPEDLEDFATKLAKFGVSITKYKNFFYSSDGNSYSEDTRNDLTPKRRADDISPSNKRARLIEHDDDNEDN